MVRVKKTKMKKYALIIGIENYPSKSSQQKVKFAKNDAEEMAVYARSADFKLIGDAPILDDKATYSQVIEWLELMFHYVQPDDFVLLYYAGHGYYSEYGGYLIPYDYDSDNEKNESTCISFNSINIRLKNKKPAKFVFFLDTCHSGFAGKQIDIRSGHSLEYKEASKKAREKVTTQINNMTKLGKHKHFIGRVVFTSSSPHETSMGIDEFKHGLFTYYLLQCLRSKSYQTEINIEELILLTKDMVISYSIKHRLKQTPMSYTNIQGEFYIPTYNRVNNNEAVLKVSDYTNNTEFSEDDQPSDKKLSKVDVDILGDRQKIPLSESLVESKTISPNVQSEEKIQTEIDEEKVIDIPLGGIAQYKVLCFGGNNVHCFAKLQYAERDARTVAAYFKVLKDKADVTLLTGNLATRPNIINWIKECNSIPRELNVIIYFGGHSSAEINENKKYLERCLWIDSNDHIAPEDHKLKTSEVLRLLNNPNHKLIFIIDACYNFDPRKGVSIKKIFRQLKDSERMSFLKDYVIISAAALNQSAFEDPQIGHGVLTYHFLKTISGKYTLSLKKKISCFKLLEILDKKVRTHRFLTDTGRKVPLKMLMENGIMINHNSKNFHFPILKPSFLNRFPFTKKS